MHIALLGPVHRDDISDLICCQKHELPAGFDGAPFLSSLIKGLLNNGHTVSAITTDSKISTLRSFTSHDRRFTWSVIPSRKHSFRPNGWKPGRALDFNKQEVRQMTKVVKSLSPDVIHAHWSYEFASVAIQSGKPCLVTVHDNHWKVARFIPTLYRFFRAIMAEKNMMRIKYATTVSSYILPFVQKRVTNVSVIPNPVFIKKSKAEIDNLIAGKIKVLHQPRIIMVNNGWTGRKNGNFGLKVFTELKKTLPGAQLHLVGTGSEPNGPANRDADRSGLFDNIIFHGVVTNAALLSLMSKMHILLHTSLEESFGVVLIEAMANGVPPFGYATAGAVPWVIQQDQLLYKEWNPDLVAKQILRLLTSPERYEIVSENLYKRASEYFSVESVVKAYEKSYHNVYNEFRQVDPANKLSK